MKVIAGISLWMCCTGFALAQSQDLIRGTVTDESTGLPIPGCSVYINSTSRGTVTSANGEFELQQVPEGNYQLIVTSIGFKAFVYSYNKTQLPLRLRVTLSPKEMELSTVTVEPWDPDGWKKWGRVFLDNFIGTTENANHCTIKNVSALRFRFSSSKNKLTVAAVEPLLIENKALGFQLTFELEEFSLDYNRGYLLYLGYPLFKEMTTNLARQLDRWTQERGKAYVGSVTRFMWSLFYDQLKQQGFFVQRHFRVPNLEKKRVQELLLRMTKASDSIEASHFFDASGEPFKARVAFADSAARYHSLLNSPDTVIQRLALDANDLLLPDSGNSERRLFFTDTLLVTFSDSATGIPRQSQIHLLTPTPIYIDSIGNYFPQQEILMLGYWAKEEKIANLLPLDYDPTEKKTTNRIEKPDERK